MTLKKHGSRGRNRKQVLQDTTAKDKDLRKAIVQEAIRELLEAEMDQALRAEKGGCTAGRLGYRSGCCSRVEENIQEKLSFYRLSHMRHKRPKSANMLERMMKVIKRRTLADRIFPNAAGRQRLLRAPAVEMRENWIEVTPYPNMEPLAESKKEAPRKIE